jgi:TATA-binding protein-associated factor
LFHGLFYRLKNDIIDEASSEENDTNHERWCNTLATKLLCVFILDRFSDFVSDQVNFHPISNILSALIAD